jgi:hypothetical protein
MDRIVLKIAEEPGMAACSLCGEPTLWTKGARLVMGDHADTVCRACSRRHVPTLVALLDLAHLADKVGRQCRHLLTPPMETLLDLARAAENYCNAAPRRRARAG